MSMFCSNCGSPVPAESRFCVQCGTPQPGAGGGGGSAAGGVPPRFGGAPIGTPVAFAPRQGLRSETGRWISEGWKLVQTDLGFFVILGLIFLVLNSVIPIVLQGPLLAGFHIAAGGRLLGRRTDINDFFKGFNYFVPTLVASIVIAVFVSLGMILCIVPGLVLAAMYQFTYLFIVDKKMDFWPAMQASHAVVKQDYFGFTIFTVVLGLLNLLGIIACIVGVLITIPISWAAITVAYRDLVGFEPDAQA
ncbi:MAG: zinc-ribbon domain-containing protein [Bryobacteraceae bacterium]|nr:zinc-ribbon domain-containing protein [Bryobacteraceae bacterium]